MIKNREIPIWYVKGFIVIIYFVGLLGLSFDFSQALFQFLTPFNLILSALILFYFHSKWSLPFVLVSLLIVIISIIAEGLGTNYGLLFGQYYYGKTLGLKIWSVPVMIGVNWLILSYAASLLLQNVNIHKLFKAFIGAAFLVLYDFFLERPAGILDMWNWENGIIPLKNYITWFIFAFIFISMLQWKKIEFKNPLAVFLVFTQMIFFIILNLSLNIWEF